MTLTALTGVLGLIGLSLSILAVLKLRRRRLAAGFYSGISALTLFGLAACAAAVAANFRTYQRLSAEQPAGQLLFKRIGERQFNGELTYPSGEHADFALRGDEWQIDARILKWRAFANLIGFDTAYRLERIGGRYARVEDERAQPRTVFPLHPPDRIDLWAAANRYHSWIPWLDAVYGSATYLPMADGAQYQLEVSQSGLIARPLNQAARDAVGTWPMNSI